MEDENLVDRKFQKELNAGVAALVLLNVVSRAGEPMYGYQIAAMVGENQQDASFIKQGTFYPILHSLEGSGLLKSKVEPSVNGPPRRYYRITPDGRDTLERWKTIWQTTRDFADSMLRS
ncbi:MAG: PadR family transcriptional regulator [Dehalococcoidia bacterium]|nr:PadR family transcriptional regulator [Dehalococcoidia bacterium]